MFGHGRSVDVSGSMSCEQAGAATLHVVCVILNGCYCDLCAFLHAYGSLSKMASGCDGALRMESCRDDGVADASAKPCPHWIPSSDLDSALPQGYREHDDGCAPCSSFYRESVLLRASWRDGCRSRGCDVLRNPSQRVVQGTMAAVRWGDTAAVPWFALYR
jgi:hypothetical protein